MATHYQVFLEAERQRKLREFEAMEAKRKALDPRFLRWSEKARQALFAWRSASQALCLALKGWREDVLRVMAVDSQAVARASAAEQRAWREYQVATLRKAELAPE